MANQQEIRSRDQDACMVCGVGRDLQVHHIYYRSHGGTDDAWNLITLCQGCHDAIHSGLIDRWFLHMIVATGLSSAALRAKLLGGDPSVQACLSCLYRVDHPPDNDKDECLLWEHEVTWSYFCTAWKGRVKWISERSKLGGVRYTTPDWISVPRSSLPD